jgi:hypothetical protein
MGTEMRLIMRRAVMASSGPYRSRHLVLFLAASRVYAFAVSMRFVLFNLYLPDLGFREGTVGPTTGALSSRPNLELLTPI